VTQSLPACFPISADLAHESGTMVIAALETNAAQGSRDLVYTPGRKTTSVMSEGSARRFQGYASIQAKRVYSVSSRSGPLPERILALPAHGHGNFCKHLVATGTPPPAIDSDGSRSTTTCQQYGRGIAGSSGAGEMRTSCRNWS